MPHGDAHKTQKAKNWMLLLILAAFVGLMYTITMLKVSGGADVAGS